MTITALARRHRLSRSTLLYYHRIGLLPPSGRLDNGYRRYSASDEDRLRQICLYRETGLPLAEIKRLLDQRHGELAASLHRQLVQLSAEVEALRRRQRVIVELLRHRRILEGVGIARKQAWVDLLRSAGFSENDMDRWHVDFEASDPAYHQRFLEFLGIPEREIRSIRKRCRSA
ncbi:MAG: MerR family transcriptional regulator [Acidobacteria bacterium]|nr:MerR family transcriptional regulator [Acidobacteriota bacterium]